ncbi:prepilin peptidase [Cypionkella sinensis]|uniref:Prepilin peptidase n=1 Tax=Cypionkella sinensis TaxID=1756043 RepID=A0ABV7IXR0_9RHOB
MISPYAALAFLPFAFAITIWVSWSDMKFMKIPNQASYAVLALWLVVGVLVVPFQTWLWGWALGLAVFVATFILFALRAIGAGDAKFAAAMAPMFIYADIRLLCGIYAACSLGALAAHRALKYVPAFRAATPDWKSWTHTGFPFGTALSGTLIFYLLVALLPLF